MSEAPRPDRDGNAQLARLIDAYLHGELSSDDLAELERRLVEDSAARSFFIDTAERASVMREVFGNTLDTHELEPIEAPGPSVSGVWQSGEVIGTALSAESQSVERPVSFTDEISRANGRVRRSRKSRRLRRKNKRPVVLALMGVAAVVLLMGSLVYFLFPRQASQSIPPTADPQIALLIHSLDARWVGDDLSTMKPGMLAGQYELIEGFAEIELAGGTRVILEGPVAFELQGPNAIELAYGRLVAEVPPVARGFRVSTADAQIVDYGTEFGVEATRDGTTRTHVFEGEVSMVRAGAISDTSTERLEAGEGQAIDRSGRVGSFDADPLAFVRSEELRAMLESVPSPYSRWLVYSYALRRDPAMRLYFGIDHTDRDAGELRNWAEGRGDPLVGLLGDPAHGWSAPQWGEGRWPEKSSLRFDHEHATAVMVPTDPALDLGESYTIACWVRLDEPGMRHLVTRVEVLPEGSDAVINLVAILDEPTSVVLRGNSIFYHTGAYVHADWLSLCSDEVLSQGQGWVLIAVTADAGRVKTYFNGELIDDRQQAVPTHRSDEPLVLGASVVQPGQGMDGWVDEVVILARAMDEDEIEAMYVAGNPAQGERE